MHWKKAGGRFGLVFGGEFALIFAANIVLVITSQFTLITPAIALIVGIHFPPLARLFRTPSYFVTGSAMILLAIYCLVAVLFGMQFGGTSLFVWSSAVAVGSAIILWSTAAYLLSQRS